MPYVHLELLKGLPKEKKVELVEKITKVISEVADKPTSSIHIVIQEIEPENLGQNGVLRG